MSASTVHQEPITRDEHGFFPSHARYLRDRAVDLQVAKAAQLRSLHEDEVHTFHPWASHVVGEALAIDYGDGHVRLQLDRTRNPSKTLIEKGRSAQPFIPPMVDPSSVEPLIIVEGPAKALALVSNGWTQTVGLGGINAGFFVPKERRKSPEVEELNPRLEPLLQDKRHVMIAFDAGRATNPDVAEAEARIAHFLRARGHAVRLIEVPLATTRVEPDGKVLHGEFDQGPDDFIKAHGRDRFAGLVTSAVPSDPFIRLQGAIQSSNTKRDALLNDKPWLASVALLDDAARGLIDKLLGTKGAKTLKTNIMILAREAKAKRLRDDSSIKTVESKSHVDLGKAYVADRAQHVGTVDGTIVIYDGVWKPVTEASEYAWIMDNIHGRLVLGSGDREPYAVRLNKPDWEGCLAAAQYLAAETWSKVVGTPPVGVSMRNGFLVLRDDDRDDPVMGGIRVELEPPSPRNGALYRHDIDWDPEAQAPEFQKFIDSLFVGAPDAETRKAAIQEFAGAALFGLGAKYQSALFLDGDGASGKSQLLSIMSALMPPGSVSSVGVQDMGDKYSLAALATSRLNCVAELSSRDWTNFEKFKALVTADMVEARHPYGRPFSFRPKAIHVFACNGMPRTIDKTDATERRMLIIRCERKFVPIPTRPWEAKAERDIASRIIQSDLQGIIAWAVEGALRLARNGHYTVPDSSVEAAQELRTESNHVYGFVDSELVITQDAGKGIPLKDIYRRYRQWTEQTGHRPMADNSLSKELQSVIRRHLGLPPSTKVSGKVSVSRIFHVEFKTSEDTEVRPVSYDLMLGSGAAN